MNTINKIKRQIVAYDQEPRSLLYKEFFHTNKKIAELSRETGKINKQFK